MKMLFNNSIYNNPSGLSSTFFIDNPRLKGNIDVTCLGADFYRLDFNDSPKTSYFH